MILDGPFEELAPEIPPEVAALPPSDILLRYQQRAIAAIETSSLLVIPKSRRIGLTWGVASYAALVAGAAPSAGGMKVWYMGYEKEMGREFVETVGMWAGAYDMVASQVHEEVISDPDGDLQTYRIQFASGFSCTALPSVARAFRGKQGLVILDEAAFMSDLAEILKAAVALLMWGGRILVVSSHNGVDNPFNLLIDAINAGVQKGRVLTITFDDALMDGLYERVRLTGKHRGMSREEWIADIRDTYGENAGEELDCIPKAGSGSWIAADDLAACETPDAGKPALYQGGLVYLGRDVARRRDFAVIWAFELVGATLWLRERWEGQNQRFSVQAEAFKSMFDRYRVAAAGIDQTGMGEPVVEAAQDAHGATRVEGVLFTPPNRLAMATLLRDRFEAGTIRVPPDPVIRTDLRALKRAGPGGRALIEEKVHPDRFWAAGLACRVADQPYQAYAYEPVARRSALDLAPDRDGPRGFRWNADEPGAMEAGFRGRGTL